MKNLFYFVFGVCCMLFTASCSSSDDDSEQTPPTPLTSTGMDDVKKDYEALVAKYPDAKNHLVEVQYILDKDVSSASASEIKPQEFTLLCYRFDKGKGYLYHADRDFKTGEVNFDLTVVDSPWLGDMAIDEDEISRMTVSLEKAIEIVKSSAELKESDGLDTRYITLRKPLWPVWDNPQYVFGGKKSRSEHVFVDAVTGKMSVLDDADASGASDYSQEILMDDYNHILDHYYNDFEDPESGYPLNLSNSFVEARYKLNALPSLATSDDIYAENVTYSFNVPASEHVNTTYVVKGFRDFSKTMKLEISEVAGAKWTGNDRPIIPDDIDNLISLDEVLYRLQQSEVENPDTDEAILHKPNIPSLFVHPQYEFKYSRKDASVFVDAITGDVQFIEL